MIKIKKKFKISLIIILILVIGSMAAIGNYFYDIALDPNSPNNVTAGKASQLAMEIFGGDKNDWLLDDSNYKDVNITSYDSLNLHGYEVENTNNSNIWVIVTHGYMSSGSNVSDFGEGFYNMGYNVLIPELRGHGKSEGNYVGLGWDDRKDILKWIDYINNKNSESKIILFGTSMGAATVMDTAGEDMPENVKLVIEDSGYASINDEFAYQLGKLYNLPSFPIVQACAIVGKIRAGFWIGDVSPVKQLKKAKVPILFIQGDEDKVVPLQMLNELYDAADVEKEKLVIEGAGHTKARSVDPETYWNTINDFIGKHIEN